MSNLENLTDKIIEEAKSQAGSMIKEAEAYRDEIVRKKTHEAEEIKVKMLEKAAFESNLLKERIVSNAEVKKRNELLNGKQIIINRVFEEAKSKLNHLPQDEYIGYLKDILSTLNLKGTEKLVVKEEYKEEISSLGLGYEIADETAKSGFQIVDEKISLNYDFNDMVDFYRDELVKDVADSLFRE